MPAYSLGTMSAWAVTTHTDQIISGAKTFQQASSGITISLRSISTNTSPLMDWHDDTGTRRGYLHTNGSFFTDNGSYIQAGWGTGAARLSTASQAYGIVQMFNNTNPGTNGALIGRVLNYGFSDTGVQRTFTDLRTYTQVVTNTAEWGHLRVFSTSAGTLTESLRVGDNYSSAWVFTNATTQRSLTVRGIASQTANLQEWQNSAGTILTEVRTDGTIVLRSASLMVGSTSWYGGELNAQTIAANRMGLVVRGSASQTANLAQFQNSAGTRLSSIDASGIIHGIDTGWHFVGTAGEPAFQNGWNNYNAVDAVQERVAFRKDAMGYVHLRGMARGGASSTTIFTLPVGYRPARPIHIPVVAGGNTGWGRIYGANESLPGDVRAYSLAGDVTTWTDITSMTFLAEA